ncbi:unnamed protein product [Acanthoscelides obtectus]|uniref:HTH CENPB-type domain-containing protein n=1 Tax=Acanthoscelides obtectus TaxID=200917 RepID=A0A9P0LCK4_ACAOB|nr:unnamed protein product [Acanthoscelides obtectus]CAK1644127.1 Jerky protein homolog [Acanthoscelides obtectus]
MENSLYKWFLKQRENHVPVSGEVLKQRARLLNEKMKETENFVASDGWLERFKTRYGIRLLSISGEKLSAQPQLVQPFKEKLMKTITELDLRMEQIYNADVSGLYWKMLPEKTYTASFEKSAPGRKPENQRITFLACTNANGSHKIKPLSDNGQLDISGEGVENVMTTDLTFGYALTNEAPPDSMSSSNFI